MEKTILEKMNMRRRTTFPESLEELKLFFLEKGMPLNGIDDVTLQRIAENVSRKEQLVADDISAIHRILDLGDTCGCDSDHRIRGRGNDGKKIGYSIT